MILVALGEHGLIGLEPPPLLLDAVKAFVLLFLFRVELGKVRAGRAMIECGVQAGYN